jgi:hypothetical protein
MLRGPQEESDGLVEAGEDGDLGAAATITDLHITQR